jgi:CheY-like chemotaxis protein
VKRVTSIPGKSRSSHRPRRNDERNLILYIEDDDQNWDVAKLRLEGAYEMLRAVNAEQACRVLRERGSEISAILMDIELRGSDLNGVELTELYRGRLAGNALPAYAQGLQPFTKPIIFVTAHGARYSDVELMLVGADKVIPKPVNFLSLSLALATLQLTDAAR